MSMQLLGFDSSVIRASEKEASRFDGAGFGIIPSNAQRHERSAGAFRRMRSPLRQNEIGKLANFFLRQLLPELRHPCALTEQVLRGRVVKHAKDPRLGPGARKVRPVPALAGLHLVARIAIEVVGEE